MRAAMSQLNLLARTYHRILKLARDHCGFDGVEVSSEVDDGLKMQIVFRGMGIYFTLFFPINYL